MTRNDLKRLFQCVSCINDPITCGKDEKDEDERGMCKAHRLMGLDMVMNTARGDKE